MLKGIYLYIHRLSYAFNLSAKMGQLDFFQWWMKIKCDGSHLDENIQDF